MNILDEITANRKVDIKYLEPALTSIMFDKGLNHIQEQHYPLTRALKKVRTIGIIGELKPCSPSQGKLVSNTEKGKDYGIINNISPIENPLNITIDGIPIIIDKMVKGGVMALSVLTEPRKFYGSFGNLYKVASITPIEMPILLKDFIVDENQLQIGKLCGASNVLVIAAIGDPYSLVKKANEYGLEAVIEVHDESDIEKILPLKSEPFPFVIGVNNRNLKDLSIDLKTSYRLIPKIREIFGEKQCIISESGVNSRSQMILLEYSGAQAALVGTSIIKGDILNQVKILSGKEFPLIKICGITKEHTFQTLNNPYVSAFGMVIEVPQSRRNLEIIQAKKLSECAPDNLIKVIITKDKTAEQISHYNEVLNPDFIQYHGNNIKELLQTLPRALIRKIIPAVRLDGDHIHKAFQEISEFSKQFFAILLDSSEGTGKTMDIKATKELVHLFPNQRFIIAGGIGAYNVQQIIEEIHPFGIDVSSSVEMNGEKDPSLIQLLVKKSTTPKSERIFS